MKLLMSVAVAAVVFTGCNSDSETNVALASGKVVTESGVSVGTVGANNIYDAGAFLYKENQIVGFVDTDGWVYTRNDDRKCGGEAYALCNLEAKFSDGILVGTCVVKKTADEEKATNGVGSLAYISVDCGDKR